MSEANGPSPVDKMAAAAAQVAGHPQAVMVLTLLQDGRFNVQFPENELMCRYLIDKARAVMDDEWRQRDAAGPRRIIG